MVYECIGLRSVQFTGSDGKDISGVTFWLSYKDDHIEGVGVEKFFVSAARVSDLTFVPSVGSKCDVRFNKYGKVSDFVEL